MISRSRALSAVPKLTPQTVQATHRRSHKYKPGHPSYKARIEGEETIYFHPTESAPQPPETVLRSQRSQASKRTVFAKESRHDYQSHLANYSTRTNNYAQTSTSSISTDDHTQPSNDSDGEPRSGNHDSSDAKYYRIAFYLLLSLASVAQCASPLALVLSLSMDLIISVLAGRWLDFKLLLGAAAAVAFILLHAAIAVVACVLLRVLGLGAAVVACAVRKTAEAALWLEGVFRHIAAFCGVDV